MLDLFYLAITLIFFRISAAFVRGCDRLAEEERGG